MAQQDLPTCSSPPDVHVSSSVCPSCCSPPGWRISHRKHHGNHGHVENDESWHPTTKSQIDEMEPIGRLGRLKFPWPLFAYP
jgi:fatty acid desaturase